MKHFFLYLVVTISTIFAFDTRTHVWVAQAVLNDLEDGNLTIEPFGSFKVDPSIKEAIVNNPRVFRMGNIGPDGFPDVIGGQVTVHPGLEDGDIQNEDETVHVHGWKSDTWFKWILSQASTPQEKAFAYGFLLHGAADTFAHTYVNMYTGDIFDMNDGETDVEKRHIFLEKFISDRLPAFTNNQNIALGEAWELVAINDELPIDFIKKTLLMNDEVAKQYALSGSASYLTKLYNFRQKVKNLPSLNLINYSFKDAWLKRIDTAIDAYIKVSSRMSQEFMKINGDSYSQLTNWLSCYSSAFTDPTTILSGTIQTACSISNSVQEDLTFFDSLKAKLDPLYAPLKSKVDSLTSGLGLQVVDLIGVAALEVITVKEQNVSEADLNEQFSIDTSDKHLLTINDIATRVKIEMGLNMHGVLNPEMYHVLYNAVVLAKLALLRPAQLNELLTRAKLSAEYTYLDAPTFSLLFGHLKTIDGNHQWLHKAPPYPRKEGFEDTTEHLYGYENNATHGWKMFVNDTLRTKLFNKLFKGPLSLGLESPQSIHFSAVLPPNYPYISCFNNPFPNRVEDKTCETIITAQDPTSSEVTTTQESHWYDDFIAYLKNIILDYFASLVSSDNIIAITENNDSVEMTTTIPANGIQF